MKKLIKLLIFTVVSSTVLLISFGVKTYAADDFIKLAKEEGFEITGDVEPLLVDKGYYDGILEQDNYSYIKNSFYQAKKVVYRREKLEHSTKITAIYFQKKDDHDLKGIMYKIATRPYQPGREWGFMGIGSYGDDFKQDFAEVTINFPKEVSIKKYTPVSEPEKYELSTAISVGVSVNPHDGECSMTFSSTVTVKRELSDLKIVDNGDLGNSIYSIKFDFNQYSNSDYVEGQVISYGAVVFRYSGKEDFKLNAHIKYHDYNGFEHGLEDVNFPLTLVN